MNRKIFRRVVAVSMVLLVLTFSVNGVTGQGPGPDQRSQPSVVTGIEAAVESRISYQGVLEEDGTPVTGSRNMIFRLHKNSTCTSQVGSDIVKNGVSVVEGLFSVTLDVTQSDFDGQALWLQVLVGGAPLSCREITATPYALSLRPGALISDTLGSPVLELLNNDGDGLYVSSANWYSIYVSDAGQDGVWVYSAGDDGFYVSYAGGDGFYVSNAGEDGLHVSNAGGDGVEVRDAGGDGVHAVSTSTSGRGVYGEASADSGVTYGIYGRSNSGTGFSGFFTNTATTGVGIRSLVGSGTVEDIHPSGWLLTAAGEFAGANGVIGAASDLTYDGYGVIGLAQGTGGRGVFGEASATSGTTYGVYGHHNSADDGAAGYFLADNNDAASEVAGVYGRVDGDGAALLPVYGVAGHAYFDGVGVGAWSYGGRIFEGRDGDYPSGTLRFYMERNGAAYADVGWNTFITAKDGSEKILYGMQSTEIWVEDYGTATLADGLATVRIAADFAGTVNLSDDYHVFLTPLGDCMLYVAGKTATSFTVRGIDGKACSIAFDYRIVAKQAGMENYRMTEIASLAEPAKTEPVPEDLPVVPPAPEPAQPLNGQSVP